MLTVTFYRDPEGTPSGVQVSGHASYADKGEDIVCAAVSVLVTNCVNSIEKFTHDVFECLAVNEEEGFLHFRLKTVSPDSRLLLDSLLLGLTDTAESYGDYIQIQFEEVPLC
jgi:hypothetical protein